jgi:hypothetical protein
MGFGVTHRPSRYAAGLAVAVLGLGAMLTAAPAAAAASTPTQSRPSSGTSLESELYDVSCTSASACTAVGWYETSPGAYDTLAEVWNGTTWTIQNTPNPTGATASYLFGASCASASACTAVGYDLNPSYTALAEGWNGTSWAIQSTPRP